MAVSLPCFVQIFKIIWQLNEMLRMDMFSQDLSLWWVSNGYLTMQQPPRSVIVHHMYFTKHDTMLQMIKYGYKSVIKVHQGAYSICPHFNSLFPGKFKWNLRYVVFKRNLVIGGWGISCEIALIGMSLDFTDDQSTLVEVMAWCRQATSHYLSQCWPRSPMPYGVTRPQWVMWSYWHMIILNWLGFSTPYSGLTTKKTSNLHITGPLGGESSGDWWIRSQKAGNVENFPCNNYAGANSVSFLNFTPSRLIFLWMYNPIYMRNVLYIRKDGWWLMMIHLPNGNCSFMKYHTIMTGLE